ncbi:MAG: cell division protein FtsW [Bacteroidetes bacterium]|nr:MAG: cell division protein FtsW [Bacteroidota bacterium]REK03490.1 MAG: cell division protein FtsW [Bacteroidota bacterium]REK34795.1 MAG: cell division protein FtsW [Bacteroidota bacterium]REK51326.1 MAG: cell division protein FtsW [Bacteroidota bacterium]
MQTTWLDKYFKGDRTIWVIVFLLSILSLLAVYSSTGTLAYKYQSGNTEYYLFKHLVILFFGLVLMYAAHKVKYIYYSRLSAIALIITIPLLLITLLGGTSLNEANRWLTLPVINITFQTSDFAKLALIMFVARMLSKKQDEIKSFKSAFLPIILPILLVCALILPANFSTAGILFISCCFLMFIGRINMKFIMALLGLAIVGFVLFVLVAKAIGKTGRIDTWSARIERFVNSSEEDNYQAEQAKIAIASGGILGKFPGNSIQRNYLPHPYSDFIYAIIIEEYGLIGGIGIIVLYLVLFVRVIRFLHHSPMAFGTLLAVGCAFSLVFQAMINMAVAVNLFPVTGQPLPMLSMGGTSIWFTSISIGIILSVSRQVEREKKEGGTELALA